MRGADPLVELLDSARAAEDGAARARERWLRRQAEESATLAGTLLDLAEQEATIGIGTRSGSTLIGRLLAVGTDVVVLRSGPGRDVCVRSDAVVTVRPPAGARSRPPTGDRRPPLDLLLAEVLAGVVSDAPRVAIVTAAGETVTGELRAVGADLVTLRLDGGPPAPLCHVALSLVEQVVLVAG